MKYDKKPAMILFDVGGTLLNDGKCIPRDGLSKLRLAAKNPDITDDETMVSLWDKYMDEVFVGLESKSGIELDIPLPCVIRYITMNTGLHFDISMAEQEEIFDRYNSTREVLDGIRELFETMESLGIRSAIISNNMMTGDGLALTIKHWIPEIKFEFCLTSADILYKKPEGTLFTAALGYAHLKAEECWYCGDSKVPDVDGASGVGMSPVLIREKSEIQKEMRTDCENGEYMTVNNWRVLKEHLIGLSYSA